MNADFAGRPEHDDFWTLSKLVIDQDNASDVVPIDDMVGAMIDPDSLLYMASQRAMRLLGDKKVIDGTIMLALYVDAFLLGAKYQTEKNKP